MTRVKIEGANPIHYLFIIDRSLSMTNDIDQVVDDLWDSVKDKMDGSLSVGWFSSENGEHDFPIRAFSLNADKNQLYLWLQSLKSTIGRTCFSEILTEAKTVIMELSSMADWPVHLYFLTDGNPVVSNPKQEQKAINVALAAIADLIENSFYVGYGGYYNVRQLKDMALISYGSVFHAQKLQNVSASIETFTNDKVELETGYNVVFTTPHVSGRLNPLRGKVSVPADAVVYVLDYTEKEEGDKRERDYIYAAAATENNDIGWYDHIRDIGDKEIIEMAISAFTNRDRGRVAQALRDRVFSGNYPKLHPGWQPEGNADTVIHVLEALADDNKAFYYPGLSNYHPISAGRRSLDKVVRVEKPDYFKIIDVAFSTTRANVSILTSADVVLTLNDERPASLPEQFNSSIYRQYTIVVDGVLNSDYIVVSSTKKTFKRLKELGVVSGQWKSGQPYTIDFSGVPLINIDMVHEWRVWNSVERYLNSWNLAKETLIILRGLIAEQKPKVKVDKSWDYTPEEQLYLANMGISKAGYNPPTTRMQEKDAYIAKEVHFYKEFKSSPSYNDVKVKRDTPTPRMLQMVNTLSAYEGLPLDRLETVYKKVHAEKIFFDNLISAVVRAMIVGGLQWDETGDWTVEIRDKEVVI